MKNKDKKILLPVLMVVFIILASMVRDSKEGIFFDMSIMNAIHGGYSQGIFTLMKFISFIGSGSFLIGLIFILFMYNIIKKNYYIIKLLLASTLGSYILNFIIKYLVNRTRPLDFFLVKQEGLSFPSGHSMVAASMYLSMAYVLSNKYKDKKIIIYSIAISIIFLMGLSRIFLGVHWPTDIIGGYIMGYILYEFIITIIKNE